MNNTAGWAASDTLPAAATGKRVATGVAIYNEIVGFLYDEAALLDQQRFQEWAQSLAEDLAYTAPLRITRQGAAGRDRSVIRTTQHYDDDYGSIMARLERLKTKSAWAEDPPSRTRRLVSNVRVWETAKPEEFQVESYLLLTRSRYEYSDLMHISCARYDLLRRAPGGGFKLARREIILDQSVIGMANLAVFL
jgi:3-phenylpropionate/cinnamic acid dioxygenase small subunit